MLLTRLNSCLKLVRGATRTQILFSPNIITARCCAHVSNSNPTEFKPVYKLPFIVTARVICRLKLYQTGIVLGLTGTSLITQADLLFPLILCTVSLTMLGVMGEYFRKLIGIIYVNPAGDLVKIAHLNFWGNRKDFTCRINDIIPPIDIGENISDAYVKLKFVEESIPTLYLSVKYGHVLDKDSFSRIIGETVQ